MSAMGQLWLGEYERVRDDYVQDCIDADEEVARERAARTLRALGFDPHEIDEQLTELGQ